MVPILCFKEFLELTSLGQTFLLVCGEKLLLKQSNLNTGGVLHSVAQVKFFHLKSVVEIFKKFQET